MLDIERIRTNPEEIRKGIQNRGKSPSVVDDFLAVDEEWRTLITTTQELRAQQKQWEEQREIEKAKEVKEEIQKLEEQLKLAEQKRHELLLEMPNIPFAEVPIGKDESENTAIKTVGKKPSFSFPIKDHLQLGEDLGIINTQKAAEVSGARFFYLINEGARLERALIHYAFDVLEKEGFTPVIPPVMIRPEVYERMGRLTKDQQEERYYLQNDDIYLVGSAEHTLGPLYMDEMISPKNLPIRMVGFSTCFRREAGSYGKDTKGIIRVHQFDKVEMYVFSDPEQSQKEHIHLLAMQERLFTGLDLPYQVVEICTGDMGPTDAQQYDIEVWIPSQEQYREVASCSNTTDYQTRGINTKIKNADGSTQYAHALNATAIALSRTIVAILENNQQKDGSVIIPKKLRKYMGVKKIIKSV